MNNKEPRNVYILTNPNFHEDGVKINKSHPVYDGIKKESTTSYLCTRL